MIFEIWYCLKAISHYWMGLVERLLIQLRVRERERETVFGCLNVLKVYRLCCFKKTEILSGRGRKALLAVLERFFNNF